MIVFINLKVEMESKQLLGPLQLYTGTSIPVAGQNKRGPDIECTCVSRMIDIIIFCKSSGELAGMVKRSV